MPSHRFAFQWKLKFNRIRVYNRTTSKDFDGFHLFDFQTLGPSFTFDELGIAFSIDAGCNYHWKNSGYTIGILAGITHSLRWMSSLSTKKSLRLRSAQFQVDNLATLGNRPSKLSSRKSTILRKHLKILKILNHLQPIWISSFGIRNLLNSIEKAEKSITSRCTINTYKLPPDKGAVYSGNFRWERECSESVALSSSDDFISLLCLTVSHCSAAFFPSPHLPGCWGIRAD